MEINHTNSFNSGKGNFYDPVFTQVCKALACDVRMVQIVDRN